MEEYTLRSTRTHRNSAFRRAADIAVVLLLCAGLLALLFKVLLVPERVTKETVTGLSEGDLILVDRFSKYLSDYKVGDIVAAEPAAGYGLYRIAALGGESYLVIDGQAFLDDNLIDEGSYSDGWPREAELYIEVPEDSVLLLPDERWGLEDLEACLVRYNDIRGEVRLRIYPADKLSLFY